MKKNAFFLLIAIYCTAAFSQDSVPSFIKDSLDAYTTSALKSWQIPGIAVCVVKDGKAVVMKGYGVTELNSSQKVDSNTLFMIGSNTKAFTATALAMLHADKKLSLLDPVQKWLPDFKLYDSWVAKEANIIDLLCHRLGFETFQGDFMYFDSDLTQAEVKEKFSKLKPLYSFRSKWGYCNAAFMVAGDVVAAASKKSWATFITDSIFTPLGMSRSIALSKNITQATNKAAAHTVADGVLTKIAYGNIDNLAPAGSISSSVSDLSHWVMALLNNGMYNGRQVISPVAIANTRHPWMVIGNGGAMYNSGHFSLYGLGWMLQEYAGKKIVSHTGGVNGFVTSVTLVPEENLGIVVLTNTDANSFFEALKWEILDAYLKLPYRNYSQVYLQYQKEDEAEKMELHKSKMDSIAAKPKSTLPLAAYTGLYVHPIYGKMNIDMEAGKMIARFEHHKGRFATLSALGENRFYAVFNEALYGKNIWQFTSTDGKVKSVTVRVADFVEFTPYEFVKQ